MTLKILKLRFYHTSDMCSADLSYERFIGPLIGRDGYYLIGNNCWFEYKGEGWFANHGDLEQYKYDLEILNHRPLTDKILDYLNKLNHEGLLSKKQKELLRIDSHWKSIRNTFRNSQIFCNRTMKKFKELYGEDNNKNWKD